MSRPDTFFNFSDLSAGIPRTLAEGIETKVFAGDQAMVSVVDFAPGSTGRSTATPKSNGAFSSVAAAHGSKTASMCRWAPAIFGALRAISSTASLLARRVRVCSTSLRHRGRRIVSRDRALLQSDHPPTLF